MLFAEGLGKRVSRGNQGVGNSLLIPERDKERAKERGEGNFLTHQTLQKAREKIGRKHASFCYFFF